MLLPRCFHQSTYVSNGISKARACVYQIAQVLDNTAVIGGVNYRHSAGLPSLESGFHWRPCRVTVRKPSCVQQLLRVRTLADGDVSSTLLHFDVEVVAEHADIAHLEVLSHFPLESYEDFHVASSDYEVVDVHSHDQALLVVAVRVHACSEAQRLNYSNSRVIVELHVPGSLCLQKPIKCLVQAQYLVRVVFF